MAVARSLQRSKGIPDSEFRVFVGADMVESYQKVCWPSASDTVTLERHGNNAKFAICIGLHKSEADLKVAGQVGHTHIPWGGRALSSVLKCRTVLVQVVGLMGQDMVIYRYDNGVGTVKSKVCPKNACLHSAPDICTCCSIFMSAQCFLISCQ